MVVRRVGEFRRWFRSAGNDTSIPQPEATPTRLVYTTPKASKAICIQEDTPGLVTGASTLIVFLTCYQGAGLLFHGPV